jgi:hypothetical protein
MSQINEYQYQQLMNFLHMLSVTDETKWPPYSLWPTFSNLPRYCIVKLYEDNQIYFGLNFHGKVKLKDGKDVTSIVFNASVYINKPAFQN